MKNLKRLFESESNGFRLLDHKRIELLSQHTPLKIKMARYCLNRILSCVGGLQNVEILRSKFFVIVDQPNVARVLNVQSILKIFTTQLFETDNIVASLDHF